MTNAAIAAKEIRTRLKAAGIKARVRSENYSGGNSVNVDLNDETPEVMKRAQAIADPFQYGHFDGMTDSYHISNDRNDLPAQARFVFVTNHISREMAQTVWSFIREHFADALGAPELLEDARKQNIRVMDQWVDQFVWREFHREDSEFWTRQS
jgi:hypothetical protein